MSDAAVLKNGRAAKLTANGWQVIPHSGDTESWVFTTRAELEEWGNRTVRPAPERKRISCQPEWALALPIQQQSVLFLALRGPDGISKEHPCKNVVRAYRATVMVAAKWGRQLVWGEQADSFMCLKQFADDESWNAVIHAFFHTVDDLPHHYFMHLMHGAEILGYKHPDTQFRVRWYEFYLDCVDSLHLTPESVEQMDKRLSDWGRHHWEDQYGNEKQSR